MKKKKVQRRHTLLFQIFGFQTTKKNVFDFTVVTDDFYQKWFQEPEWMILKPDALWGFFSVFDPLSKIVDLQRPSRADWRRVMVVGVAEV